MFSGMAGRTGLMLVMAVLYSLLLLILKVPADYATQVWLDVLMYAFSFGSVLYILLGGNSGD